MTDSLVRGDTKNDAAILAELERLVAETYRLWDEDWVGFSWRAYTFNHVQRVRRLALTLGAREGADLRPLDYAGLLHDITKSWDGEIMMRDGKRVLDENGFWLNELLPPARQNKVTRLYGELGLAGTVHHISGGRIATALLQEHGFDAEFCAAVREIIESHLKVTEKSSTAGRCIYDADTIDANIGLPAFYRNIHITMHRQEQEFQRRGEDLDAWLAENLEAFLNPYLRERIPTWNIGKKNDFASKMTTESGREVSLQRVERLARIVEGLQAELDDFAYHVENGRLAIVRYLMTHRDDPDFAADLAYLKNEWLASGSRTDEAAQLLEEFEREAAGER